MAARFGPFELDPQRRQLSREGQVPHLTPKAFDLLLPADGENIIGRDPAAGR